MKHTIVTRWPAKQVGERVIEITIPENGPPLLNVQAIEELRLTEAETMAAEAAALKAIILV